MKKTLNVIVAAMLACITGYTHADPLPVPPAPPQYAKQFPQLAHTTPLQTAASPNAVKPVEENKSIGTMVPSHAPAAQTSMKPVMENRPIANSVPLAPLKNTVTVSVPGVGKFIRDDKLSLPSIIRPKNNAVQNVMISNIYQNLIATPFKVPRVIVTKSKQFAISTTGQDILIATVKKNPFVIYVTGSEPGDPIITMVLTPEAIPPQNITIQLNTSNIAPRKADTDSYEKQLLDLLRTVAAGKTPDGYAEGEMPNITAFQRRDGLHITPLKRYSGTHMDIYEYRIDDDQQRIQLSEPSFYQKGVLAVSLFPKIILDKGEHTFVYIVADKSLLDGGANAEAAR